MSKARVVLAALLLTAAGFSQVDRMVDATGAGGSHTTIASAMNASSPGDRILVAPGVYPAFDFIKGVSVIGLGADPSAVVIHKIYFHPNVPNQNYRAQLSNVKLDSPDPLDTLVLHGNELALGTFVVDSVIVDGGIFLRGGMAGFYLMISNSRIQPAPGHGFTGEACYLGGPGNSVDLTNTKVVGWNADPSQLATAGVGVRLNGGTQARFTNSRIWGGDGVAATGYRAGATAVASGVVGAVNLTIDGNSQILGGDGVGAAGGHGVAIQSGSILQGPAIVQGGTGTPTGAPYSPTQPVVLATPRVVSIEPSLAFAEGPITAEPGQTLGFTVSPGAGDPWLGISFALEVPGSGLFIPLVAEGAMIIPGNSFSVQVPTIPGYTAAGLMVFVQGAVIDGSGGITLTNAASIRVALE
jgi:hypothetical protein